MNGFQASGPTGGANQERYVLRTEPNEGAFTVEVPQGWSVEGGVFRFGPADIRAEIGLKSPGLNFEPLKEW